MAADDDAIRIIAKFEGEEEAKRLAAALSLATQKFEALYKSLGPTDAATKTAAANVAGLAKQLETARSSTQSAGQALMQMGYAVDDLQYGFKGIANNIQPILQSLPGLGQMAPILSVAAIAAYQLYTHWDQVMGLFDLGIPQPALKGPELLAANIKKASEEMEELLKKTRLEWYEVEKLGKLRAQLESDKKDLAADKAVESAVDDKSDAEKEIGGGFRKAMAESGGASARKELLDKLKDSADAKGLVYNEAKGRMDTPENATRDMLAAALAGDKISRDAIAKILDQGSQFQKNIGKYSPETKKRKAQDERVNEAVEGVQDDLAKQEAKDKKEREDKVRRSDEAVDEVQRDLAAQEVNDRKEALEKARKATAGTAFDSRVDQSLVRSALKSGGESGVASREVSEQVSRELQSRGLSKSEADSAAGQIVQQHAGKLGDEVNEMAMKPRKMNAPDRISSANFARSVEASGAKTMQNSLDAMKENLAELVRLKKRGTRLK